MATDYGTISVCLHPGMTYDQRCSVMRLSLDNQLETNNRNHYNEILNQCLDVLSDNDDVTIDWNMRDYKYTLKVTTFEY